jgi:hypothetical protein
MNRMRLSRKWTSSHRKPPARPAATHLVGNGIGQRCIGEFAQQPQRTQYT